MKNWEDLLEWYLRHLRGLRRSESTIKNMNNAGKSLKTYCLEQGVLWPEQMTSKHFDGWILELRRRGGAATTIYSYQRQMRTWLAWATLNEHLLTHPLKFSPPCRHPKVLGGGAPDEKQVLTMLNAPDLDSPVGQRDRALLEFLYGTGLRVGECCQVLLDHLDLAQLRLWVKLGKGGRSRQLPVGPHLGQVLTHYVETVRLQLKPRCESLWLNKLGSALSVAALEALVRGYRKQCQLEKFSCHSFRHAYATHMLQRGAHLVALQRLLGHQTLTMTARYTHLVPLDLEETLLKSHPRGRRKKGN